MLARVFDGQWHPSVVRAGLAAFSNHEVNVADKQLREFASRALRQAVLKNGGTRDAALLQCQRLLANVEQSQV